MREKKYKILIFSFIFSLRLFNCFSEDEIKSKNIIFTKKMFDGSIFILEKERREEMRRKPKGAFKELHPKAIFISGEYITEKYWLIRKKKGKKEIVWGKEISYLKNMKLLQSQVFVIHDVEQIKNKVIILYSSMGHTLIQIQKQDKQGFWSDFSSVEIAEFGGIEMGKIIKERKKILIEIKYENGNTRKWILNHNIVKAFKNENNNSF